MNIFVSICHFTTAKTALKSNMATVKARERYKEICKVRERNFASPNLKRPESKAFLLIRASICNELTHVSNFKSKIGFLKQM